MENVRKVAQQEDRALNTQLVRFIQDGLDLHLDRTTLRGAFNAFCLSRGWEWSQLAEYLGVSLDALTSMSEHPAPTSMVVGFVNGPEGLRPVHMTGRYVRLAEQTQANEDRLLEVIRDWLTGKPGR
jgi:hypothetical protein